MRDNNFEKINKLVHLRLKALAPELYYHSIDHTLDVLKHSARIGLKEGVDEHEMYLLKVAALYHDAGFLETYIGHEEKSCAIFLQDAGKLNFTELDKKIIQGLIMATKVPQKPKTLLQKIICDADLDYLGRNDFPKITNRLKKEFLHYAIITSEAEWKKLQKKFLKNHRYHTTSSQKLREPVKKMNYTNLE